MLCVGLSKCDHAWQTYTFVPLMSNCWQPGVSEVQQMLIWSWRITNHQNRVCEDFVPSSCVGILCRMTRSGYCFWTWVNIVNAKKMVVRGLGWGVGGAADVDLKLGRIPSRQSLVCGDYVPSSCVGIFWRMTINCHFLNTSQHCQCQKNLVVRGLARVASVDLQQGHVLFSISL